MTQAATGLGEISPVGLFIKLFAVKRGALANLCQTPSNEQTDKQTNGQTSAIEIGAF